MSAEVKTDATAEAGCVLQSDAAARELHFCGRMQHAVFCTICCAFHAPLAEYGRLNIKFAYRARCQPCARCDLVATRLGVAGPHCLQPPSHGGAACASAGQRTPHR